MVTYSVNHDMRYFLYYAICDIYSVLANIIFVHIIVLSYAIYFMSTGTFLSDNKYNYN